MELCWKWIQTFNWSEFDFTSLDLDWELNALDDFEFSMPFGIEMANNVITKPYSIINDVGADELPFDTDECFFMLLDRNGKWRINTILKGFADKLCGLASSYTMSGDIILIGKRKQDMMIAFNQYEGNWWWNCYRGTWTSDWRVATSFTRPNV